MSFPSNTITTTEEPKVKKKTAVKAKTSVSEEGQVIVHCLFQPRDPATIRIWKSTFLFDQNSSHKSKLLHAEGISIHPVWTHIFPGKAHRFTLYFSPLPKSCKVFDLIEKIPEEGAFEIRNIARNKTDVYTLRVD